MKTLAQSVTLALVGCACVLAGDENDQGRANTGSVKSAAKNFTGSWSTEYGLMHLIQTGNIVTGTYDLGTVQGTVEARVLTFRYQEANTSGQGRFTLADDGSTFEGRWREDGQNVLQRWNGKRTDRRVFGFAGLWQTSYGLMRLSSDGQDVRGAYDYPSGQATITGQIKQKRLIFRYQEPEAAGSGWFEVSADGQSIQGQWRPDGAKQWRSWTGTRKLPKPGRVWLVILEANWERSIDEKEYAFGDMLDNYFTMSTARHVDVRHRFFHDATDLRRFCSKVQFLAEPVVLLISTHGTSDGITVFGKTISADVIAESLASASNLRLLHLSGCSMMAGKFPNEIHRLLKDGATFPISGYKTSVAWDASALGDFTFLSLLLVRRLEPEAAARQAIRVSPYLGDQRLPGSAFRPLGLTVLPPPDRSDKALDP